MAGPRRAKPVRHEKRSEKEVKRDEPGPPGAAVLPHHSREHARALAEIAIEIQDETRRLAGAAA